MKGITMTRITVRTPDGVLLVDVILDNDRVAEFVRVQEEFFVIPIEINVDVLIPA